MPSINDAAQVHALLAERAETVAYIHRLRRMKHVKLHVYEGHEVSRDTNPWDDDDDMPTMSMFGMFSRMHRPDPIHFDLSDKPDGVLRGLIKRVLLARVADIDMQLHELGFDFPDKDWHSKLEQWAGEVKEYRGPVGESEWSPYGHGTGGHMTDQMRSALMQYRGAQGVIEVRDDLTGRLTMIPVGPNGRPEEVMQALQRGMPVTACGECEANDKRCPTCGGKGYVLR